MLRSGDLRHYGSFQKKSVTRADNGEEVITWTDVINCWVSIEPLVGREFWTAQQINSEINVKIRCRYFRGLETDWRFSHQGKSYDLISIQNIGLYNREYVIYAKEVNS